MLFWLIFWVLYPLFTLKKTKIDTKWLETKFVFWRESRNLIIVNIYIFIAIALDETSIFVELHFSMQNIYQLLVCDLGHAVGRSNVNVSQ